MPKDREIRINCTRNEMRPIERPATYQSEQRDLTDCCAQHCCVTQEIGVFWSRKKWRDLSDWRLSLETRSLGGRPPKGNGRFIGHVQRESSEREIELQIEQKEARKESTIVAINDRVWWENFIDPLPQSPL